MYAGHVACCLLVSHVEYVPCTLLRLEKRWVRNIDGIDRRTKRWMNVRQTVRLCLPLDAASITRCRPNGRNTTGPPCSVTVEL